MSDPIVTAIIGGAGVVAGALITGLLQRRKIRAESEKDSADANEQIRKTVMALLDPLQKRVEQLETELDDWKNWAERLVHQVKCLGAEPVPFKERKKK